MRVHHARYSGQDYRAGTVPLDNYYILAVVLVCSLLPSLVRLAANGWKKSVV
ncbi:MAG: hypothetical protein LBD62_05245 [Candidatus Margulisbacteria bacterium]|nr:hypothetical protein [Candidatus Margulisiibacteriota bacterium]